MGLEKFGALWEGKPGSKAVFSGKLQDGRKIVVFRNDRKEKPSQPDYRLMVDDGKGSPKPDDNTPF